MASDARDTMEQQHQLLPKFQIYNTSSNGISPFWKEKYEKDAKKYWDVFYKRHQNKFFKDRHYLDKEWGQYFSVAERKVILEVGCGAGNAIFPLIATYPDIFIHACDFSPRAVNLVKTHKDFMETRVNAFVCDLTADDLGKQISASSVDIVTMIFVLSAVSPEKMPLVLQNIKKVLKPNGYVLFRDYAIGDLAQERFNCKDQKISENFYVRGDGTRAFYFSDKFLMSLFNENGFDIEEHGLCCKQVENRSREIVMNRRWVQAVFRLNLANSLHCTKPGNELRCEEELKESTVEEPVNSFEIDMSEGIAVEMFGISTYNDEIIEVNLRESTFKIKVLSKEYQHTCKSTGLMLWESARLMASIIASNPTIVAGKRVLELGCGCGGICSMVAVRSADLVIATDGDANALNLLTQNVEANLKSPFVDKLITRRLEWGNRDRIEAIKELNGGGFEVIIGTDVTYVPEAISPLFATAKELISSNGDVREDCEPALILCHVLRRVDEPSILSTASHFGFKLVDRWPEGIPTSSSKSIIRTWFSENAQDIIPSTALNIMYFQRV
ncbi:Methyltransferase-like protein [Actinidia chinensis var. chinensis]|uniref:Methyltransferase-like protein n=1 Tax=Actinidia chinensis var. chinensis TaxID=1590841 RepID=A0A2R6PMM7_ACTCC|nr:Methyltransferase-like protein [Actinidia chinensis var. chinensis]